VPANSHSEDHGGGGSTSLAGGLKLSVIDATQVASSCAEAGLAQQITAAASNNVHVHAFMRCLLSRG